MKTLVATDEPDRPDCPCESLGDLLFVDPDCPIHKVNVSLDISVLKEA